jgi:hypothetical protein
MLAELASAYVAALNDNAAPTISTAWDRVVDRQCTVRCDLTALVLPAPVQPFPYL